MADDSSIAASGLNIEIIYRGPSLLDLTYKPNEEGVWHLDVTPINGQIYSTEISAICTFSFLSDFDYLDLNTTHPTMQVLPGQPISSILKTKSYWNYIFAHKYFFAVKFVFFRFYSIYQCSNDSSPTVQNWFSGTSINGYTSRKPLTFLHTCISGRL